MTKVQQIQTILGVDADDRWGPKSQAALDALLGRTSLYTIHSVKASSFADPEDIRRFRRCKKEGKTDQECFRVGDNGIGKWGDDTTLPIPMCALPPDDWMLHPAPRGARVRVWANGREVVCELRDSMPAKRNITNGAGIDLNPEACERLGLRPPIMVPARWQFLP